MAIGWIRQKDGYEFRWESWKAVFRDATGYGFGPTNSSADVLRLRPTSLRFRVEHRADEQVVPIVGSPLIQPPFLITPYEVSSDAGFSLTSFARADSAGLDVDFRLTTTATLEHVALETEWEWSGASQERLPGPADSTGASTRSLRLDRFTFENGEHCAIISDPGEFGRTSIVENRLVVELFGEPLEKGVLLVGRFAIRDGRTRNEDLHATLARWRERPTSSL